MVRVHADYAAWALGFGGFLAVEGSALVAPPDPFSQLLWTGLLAVGTVPTTYVVVARAHRRRERGQSRRLVSHFVVVSVVGALAVTAVGPLVDRTPGASVARAVVFLAVVAVVSWWFFGRRG
ncbi:MAG: hypothetical protein ABEI96_07775 [Haloarculaceae archaeon]